MILHKNNWKVLFIWDKKGWIWRMHQISFLSKNYWARDLTVSILVSISWHWGLSNEKAFRDTFILLKKVSLEYFWNILQVGKQLFGVLSASRQKVFQCSLRGCRISIGKAWDAKRLPHSTFPWCQLFLSLEPASLGSGEVVPQHLTSVPAILQNANRGGCPWLVR